MEDDRLEFLGVDESSGTRGAGSDLKALGEIQDAVFAQRLGPASHRYDRGLVIASGNIVEGLFGSFEGLDRLRQTLPTSLGLVNLHCALEGMLFLAQDFERHSRYLLTFRTLTYE